ncbi:MAG: SDR family oxidoreductase [Promethearchaeota archaeon]
MSMKNETAIVTGSTSGIGKKIAELFLREGCKVSICSRNETHVKSTLSEFQEKFGDSVIGFPCDVSEPVALKKLVDETIETFGSIRILVANAGLSLTYGPFGYLSLEQVSSEAKIIIGTNLMGMMYSIAAVLPQMIKQKYGRIVTISGGGADRPIPNMTIYSASKGGVIAFSKCLAEEFKEGGNDLKINIFHPGMQRTNLTKVSKIVEGWKDEETLKYEMDLVLKYVAGDIEESCSKVIPYVLPSCKANGIVFKGFSIMKLIKGFRKLNKARKE